ncbi:MAG TPA: hypothetical protein VFQ65_20935 [Kofleriaceae bacterium]|nr:hypothetical protein [Kofleriaceae bacterium]
MARATKVLAVTTTVAVGAALWLFVDNRALRGQLAEHATGSANAPVTEKLAEAGTDPWSQALRTGAGAKLHGPAPALPEVKEEGRLERRKRRQAEFAAMFGRNEGETADEYRARIVPLIKTGLAIPRSHVEDLRKQAEAQAHVTAEQSKKLDAAFDKVYDNVLDYTNKAIADGVLSPYERNVSGWLEYAGGLGTMLGEANSQIGQVLSPDQLKAFGDSGFEWGEYLGLEAPWEKLDPPPPPKH